ncbi:MAG TPA: hypothetical protein IAC82_07335 [Candidatus Merdivicinus intestinigallinarum]|nr:hypothetical protein [Candidatus Merdivicinus intestinigallinarum]
MIQLVSCREQVHDRWREFHSVNKVHGGQSLWSLLSSCLTTRSKTKSYFSRPGREQKEKEAARKPPGDDPPPSFCLQNGGLEFSKFFSTAHLRQQTA